ncbi:MAG TPA: hypothetical protein VIH55_03315 [Acidimicrobiia bacterium]
MSRLTWIETFDGWMSGRYQIELAAPGLWVLSRRPRRDSGPGPCRARVARTAGSLRELKHAAEDMEKARLRRRRLLTHLAITAILVMVTLIGSASGWDLTVPALVAIFAIMLRTVVVWIETATGSPWSVISDNYQ